MFSRKQSCFAEALSEPSQHTDCELRLRLPGCKSTNSQQATNLPTQTRHQLEAICDCAESVTRALLNESQSSHLMDSIEDSELVREPNQSAKDVLLEVSNLAGK